MSDTYDPMAVGSNVITSSQRVSLLMLAMMSESSTEEEKQAALEVLEKLPGRTAMMGFMNLTSALLSFISDLTERSFEETVVHMLLIAPEKIARDMTEIVDTMLREEGKENG